MQRAESAHPPVTLRPPRNKLASLSRLCLVGLFLAVYPALVLLYTWHHVLKSDFEGGRNGMLDAYRHALASAVVSYTLGNWAVDLTTRLCESGQRPSNRMDTHNNRLGAKIGDEVKSFAQIESTVRQAVARGAMGSTDADQITWLPRSTWRAAKFW